MDHDHAAHRHMDGDSARAQAHSAGSSLNRLAFSATLHCLSGCAVGEILGLAIGTALCRVVRRLEVGFAVQFLTPIDAQEVEEAVRAPHNWEDAMRARQAEASAQVEALVDSETVPEEANYAI